MLFFVSFTSFVPVTTPGLSGILSLPAVPLQAPLSLRGNEFQGWGRTSREVCQDGLTGPVGEPHSCLFAQWHPKPEDRPYLDLDSRAPRDEVPGKRSARQADGLVEQPAFAGDLMAQHEEGEGH